MTTYEIRSLGGKVIHEVEVGDRKIAYPPDLHGLDFRNANLRWADLQGVNLEGAILLGADLAESNLQHANLKNVDARYCDFTKADLRESNLENTQMYPAETIGAKFYGAKFLPDSDAAYYARIAHEEMIKKMRIHPNSVAYRKLQRINGWTSPAPSPDIPPVRRGRPRWFVESL
jgi:Pentapeptide repeats (8 copies)